MDKNEHTVDSQQMKMNQRGPMGKGAAGARVLVKKRIILKRPSVSLYPTARPMCL